MAHFKAGEELTAGQINTIAHQGIQLVDEQILETDSAAVEFSSLPQDGANLLMVGSGGVAGASIRDVSIRFNGDAGTSYSFLRENRLGDGSAPYYHAAGVNHMAAARFGYGTLQSSYQGLILGYSRTDRNKTLVSYYGAVGSTAAVDMSAGQVTGHWNSTSAITDITFFQVNGYSILAGSIFQLYRLGFGA